MRLRSSTTARADEAGFCRATAVVECTPTEWSLLERLVDEFDPEVDVFSVRIRPPDLAELDIQFAAEPGSRPDRLLRHRMGRLAAKVGDRVEE